MSGAAALSGKLRVLLRPYSSIVDALHAPLRCLPASMIADFTEAAAPTWQRQSMMPTGRRRMLTYKHMPVVTIGLGRIAFFLLR